MTNLDYIHQGLKHWQTAISSAVGFTGIIVSLLVNSFNNRQAEKRKNQYEVDNVRNAISVELRAIIAQAHDVISGINEDEDTDILVRCQLKSFVYDSIRHRVVALTPLEIAPIIRNYIFTDLVASRILLIGERQHVFDDVRDDWVLVKGQTSKKIVAENMRNVCINCAKALTQMEIHQSIEIISLNQMLDLEQGGLSVASHTTPPTPP